MFLLHRYFSTNKRRGHFRFWVTFCLHRTIYCFSIVPQIQWFQSIFLLKRSLDLLQKNSVWMQFPLHKKIYPLGQTYLGMLSRKLQNYFKGIKLNSTTAKIKTNSTRFLLRILKTTALKFSQNNYDYSENHINFQYLLIFNPNFSQLSNNSLIFSSLQREFFRQSIF